MSESNKNDGHVTENTSTVVTKSKKKERRQKAKNQSGGVDSTTATGDASKTGNESVKSDDPNAAVAGTSSSVSETGAAATASASNPADLIDEAKLKSLLDEAYKYKVTNPNILPILRDAAKTPQEALQKPYKFWSTQPVPKFDEVIERNEPIEPNKKISEIRADPYALPDGFTWDTMKLDDPLVLTELYTLLNENYVEDDDAMFRFDYQPEFLKWALQPPGWRKGNKLRSAHCSQANTNSGFHFLFFHTQTGMWAFELLNRACSSVSSRLFRAISASMIRPRKLSKLISCAFTKSCARNVLRRCWFVR